MQNLNQRGTIDLNHDGNAKAEGNIHNATGTRTTTNVDLDAPSKVDDELMDVADDLDDLLAGGAGAATDFKAIGTATATGTAKGDNLKGTTKAKGKKKLRGSKKTTAKETATGAAGPGPTAEPRPGADYD